MRYAFWIPDDPHEDLTSNEGRWILAALWWNEESLRGIVSDPGTEKTSRETSIQNGEPIHGYVTSRDCRWSLLREADRG